MLPRSPLLAAALVLWAAAPASATPAAPASGACAAPEYRQFDFWIGAWEVHEGDRLAGTNRIEAILGGCALVESWNGVSGMRGTSLNFYFARDRNWHQTWVDTDGLLLELSGGLVEGRMVLAGRVPDADGSRAALHRITWTPAPDGSVRQHWQSSRDDGATWTDLFDGVYRRIVPERPAAEGR
jgi:hypothetical protein